MDKYAKEILDLLKNRYIQLFGNHSLKMTAKCKAIGWKITRTIFFALWMPMRRKPMDKAQEMRS